MEKMSSNNSNWFDLAKQETQKLLTEDFEQLIQKVSDEEKSKYEEMKKDTTVKLDQLEVETQRKLEDAQNQSSFVRDELIVSIKQEYQIMKNRYSQWLKK